MIKVFLNIPVLGRKDEDVAKTYSKFRKIALAALETDDVMFLNDMPNAVQFTDEAFRAYYEQQTRAAYSADIMFTYDGYYTDACANSLVDLFRTSRQFHYRHVDKRDWMEVPEDVWILPRAFAFTKEELYRGVTPCDNDECCDEKVNGTSPVLPY